MRKLTDILAEQAAAAADDRDLTSRTDLRKERKRVETEGAELADALVSSTPRQLSKLGLPEAVLEVVLTAKAIASPVARARASKAVRRELRLVDSALIAWRLANPGVAHSPMGGEGVAGDPDPAAVEVEGSPEVAAPGIAAATPTAVLEDWVQRLLQGGEESLSGLVESCPSLDRQQIRALVRNLRKAEGAARPRAEEALRRVLRPAVSKLARTA